MVCSMFGSCEMCVPYDAFRIFYDSPLHSARSHGGHCNLRELFGSSQMGLQNRTSFPLHLKSRSHSQCSVCPQDACAQICRPRPPNLRQSRRLRSPSVVRPRSCSRSNRPVSRDVVAAADHDNKGTVNKKTALLEQSRCLRSKLDRC